MSGTGQTDRGDGVWRPLLIAGVIFALFFGGIGVWAWQAPVAGAVVATGEITVEGESKTVQHLEGGIVAELLVSEGGRVEARQPLIRLDATEAEAARAALIAERDALAASAVRLRAELSGEQIPDFSVLTTDANDGLDAAIAGQAALFDARARERTAERDMLQSTLTRLAARVLAIRAEIDGLEAQRLLVEEDVTVARQLARDGMATRSAMRENERDLAGLSGALASLAAQLAEAQAAESEAVLQLAETDTRRISAVSEELAKVVARMAEIAPTLAAEEKRIERSMVRAPVAGVVVGLNIATVGGVVAPGEPIMDIVPASARLVAEARVSPDDRERVTPEMTAQIRVAGLQRRNDPALDGVVTRISADRLSDETDTSEGYYAMTVVLTDGPDGFTLAPGMPVTAIVATSPRSVLDYVLSPMRDAIARSMREE